MAQKQLKEYLPNLRYSMAFFAHGTREKGPLIENYRNWKSLYP
jgi:hypothetical protein